MTIPTREQVVQLKPCPFCGSADVRNVSSGHAGPSTRFHAGDEIFAVNCGDCGAGVPNRYRNNLVVDSWNKRVPLARADLEAELESLRRIVRVYETINTPFDKLLTDEQRAFLFGWEYELKYLPIYADQPDPTYIVNWVWEVRDKHGTAVTQANKYMYEAIDAAIAAAPKEK